MSNTTTATTADLKAELAARAAANKKAGTSLAKAALKNLPEHTFSTGSKGVQFQSNIEVDGKPLFVLVRVVDRSTVVKDA